MYLRGKLFALPILAVFFATSAFADLKVENADDLSLPKINDVIKKILDRLIPQNEKEVIKEPSIKFLEGTTFDKKTNGYTVNLKAEVNFTRSRWSKTLTTFTLTPKISFTASKKNPEIYEGELELTAKLTNENEIPALLRFVYAQLSSENEFDCENPRKQNEDEAAVKYRLATCKAVLPLKTVTQDNIGESVAGVVGNLKTIYAVEDPEYAEQLKIKVMGQSVRISLPNYFQRDAKDEGVVVTIDASKIDLAVKIKYATVPGELVAFSRETVEGFVRGIQTEDKDKIETLTFLAKDFIEQARRVIIEDKKKKN